MTQRSTVTLAVLALLVGSVLGAGATMTAVGPGAPSAPSPGDDGTNANADTVPSGGWHTDDATVALDGGGGVATFDNESTFRSYVERGSLLADGNRFDAERVRFTAGDAAPEAEADAVATAAPQAADAAVGGDGGDGGGHATVEVDAPSRVANTNVQVAGLDEPDIVKTDGRHFYYAPEGRLRGPRPFRDDVPPGKVEEVLEHVDAETHVVDASDPRDPEAVADIGTTGKLLQTGDTLVVLGGGRVAGYDVGDPSNPTEAWSTPLNGSLVTARERNGTLYVVTETAVGAGTTCPIEPLGTAHAIACEDIHRPGTQIPVDATYSAFAIDARSGEVRDSVSFVGTSGTSAVYVSGDALYLTYTKPTNRAAVTAEFIREEFDRAPAGLEARVAEIQSYDITPASKEREIRRAFEQWVATLPPGEREQVRESFRARLSEFVGAHQRDLAQTGVVRVEVGQSLSVDATATVPGRPLNQFSLDQHDGTLRIATTVPGVGTADSENDLYTLDSETLDVRGNVTGMGVTERVYSVRYVGDTAYVVTFRRVDPFHVVDLSDPANPKEVGELKLPGFSSYLHPVDDDHVLGVGEEDGRVKTVLFDVSDPSDPTIADSRILAKDWSAVSETHHAFLMDRKHGVFVLPAGQQSVVMDYTGGSLDVERRIVTGEPATRARYVGDYLYVFAGDSVTIVDETSWNRAGTLRLDN